MAGKLKDDHIRWILDVDAKGAQGEIQKFASTINNLKQQNDVFSISLKKLEKQLSDNEKEFQKLEKAGLTSSTRYKELESLISSQHDTIDRYTNKIKENTKAIDDNNNKIAIAVKEMNIEDMTMSQLKQRAYELQNQLDHTSQSLSPEAYTQLSEELINTKDRIEQLKKSTVGYIETVELETLTMNELKKEAKELQEQLDNTSLATDPEKYKSLQKELDAINNRMEVVKNANKNLLQQFAGMNHPIGTAAKAVQGFGTALKALIANPVGIVIMAIAAAFSMLKTAIEGSIKVSSTFNGILKALESTLDSLKRIVTEVFELLINFFTFDFSAVKENIKNVKDLSSNMWDNAVAAYEATKAEVEFNNQIARNNDLIEVNKARINELRQIAQDSTKTIEDRKKASEELLKLEKDNYGMAVENVSNTYKTFVGQNQNLIDAMKRGSAEQFAEVEKYMKLVEEGTELTFQQRTELANLVNDITSTLDKGTGEQQEKFRGFFSDLSSLQQQYFATSRRDQLQAIRVEKENAATQAQEAKKAMDNRLKEIDRSRDYEINLLKKSRMEGQITEKEYNDKVEELTIDALNRKINIKGQEKHQLIQYESQILDAQIKQQQTADKILLDELQKEKEKELRILEVSKNAKLEKLQEEETDRSIYALRAAEIEMQAAEARLTFVEQFAETLKQAEFNNNKTRLEAINENSEEILSAESASLKQRENLQKQFAKTTTNFERQYNIKTWEQRRKDELQILQKQYEAKLLSEETYQLAITAIDKKYKDEKLRIREQYAITSMSELYNAEMEALLEQHEKGLLEEKEYEKAKLQIKLKYAQEYAHKIADFTSITSDTVSALMSAETANIETEYATRIQAAGDNKDEVERLENEKAQKQLDIEKKYADVQFAIKAAEIISSTAVAAMNAYSAMAAIPFVGPGLGAAAAALVAVTGAAQLVVANEERKRVKSLTLSGSSSGGKAPSSGEIKLKEGFAEGGSNTGDHTDGGYTGEGNRYDVAGWVPYHHGEYFVAVPEMKDPAVQDHVRAIDKIRRKRTNRNPLPSGFAEGGANTPQSSVIADIDNTIAADLLAVLNDLKHGRVKVNYGVTELQAAEKEKLQAEYNFTKG